MERNNESDIPELSTEEIRDLQNKRIDEMDRADVMEDDVLKNGHEAFYAWNSYFQENITRGKDDVNFLVRDQWTAIERSEYTRLFKPAMTCNKLYPDIKKIIGEQRQNRPNLQVRSLNGRSSQEEIDLRTDLVRTIAYQSQSDLIYQHAFKSAVTTGYGAFEILIDYESARSFSQVLKIGMIVDATRSFFDAKAILPHKGDGDHSGVIYEFSSNEFYATWPYIENPMSFVDPLLMMNQEWKRKDTICVAKYNVKEWYPLIIHKLSDGSVVTDEGWKKIKAGMKDMKALAKDTLVVGKIIENRIPRIITTRQTQDFKQRQYLLLQNQIIDFMEWPSKILPHIFVDGDSYYIEGQQYAKSIIHEARDAQKCLNFFFSEIAAEVKNRRREQWMATPDNIKGQEEMWRNPEVQLGALIAQPDPKTGQMPTKMPAWEISQGLLVNCQRVTQDIREILGTSESQNLQGKDISGKARRERKLESGMASYTYSDNMNQAIAQGGRAILDLAPYVYGGEERVLVISKSDGKSKSMVLNKRKPDGTIENELSYGEYDIEIDAGPSFAVQKDISLEFLAQTVSIYPQAFPLMADLWAKNLDVEFMPQISERFKTLVPPEILAKENGELPPPPPPPSPQEQMMQKEIELKQKALEERAMALKLQQEKHELEKAQIFLDMEKLKHDAHQKGESLGAEKEKSELDFVAKISKVFADAHR